MGGERKTARREMRGKRVEVKGRGEGDI